MITLMVIVHLLFAGTLLGALTHQAFSVSRSKPATGGSNILQRYSNVNSSVFVNAVVVLFCLTALMGGLLYPRYRIDVRTTLEDLQLRGANGVFEIKEHLAAIGLGLLPVYWLFWYPPLRPEDNTTRRWLVYTLTFIVWWNFLVGEYLNNIKGLWP